MTKGIPKDERKRVKMFEHYIYKSNIYYMYIEYMKCD